MWIPKLLLAPIKFLAHKRPKLALLDNYWHFWPIWSHGQPKNDAKKTKDMILAQKLPNLAQNWLFWPNLGIFGPFGPMADHLLTFFFVKLMDRMVSSMLKVKVLEV